MMILYLGYSPHCSPLCMCTALCNEGIPSYRCVLHLCTAKPYCTEEVVLYCMEGSTRRGGAGRGSARASASAPNLLCPLSLSLSLYLACLPALILLSFRNHVSSVGHLHSVRAHKWHVSTHIKEPNLTTLKTFKMLRKPENAEPESCRKGMFGDDFFTGRLWHAVLFDSFCSSWFFSQHYSRIL